MRPLDRKLFRDLNQMKGQMTAVAMVMLCGLAVMIMARSLILSLETSRDDYYLGHRFADVFSDLTRAPNALRARLAEIDGVAVAETRVSGALVLDLPGMAEPAGGLVVSLPEDRPQQLNRLYLRTGRLPEIGSRNQVVASEGFADAHGLRPGDVVDATIYGSRERLHIVGIALSPEFVFESRPGDIVPDPRRFGVFWMNERALADALDMRGAFNNVVLALAPGADRRAVMADIDRLLAPYGGRQAYDRDDHHSARLVEDELQGLRIGAIAFPILFLGISAFMTSAALTRLIRLQREQIAQLKAFGYSSRIVTWHDDDVLQVPTGALFRRGNAWMAFAIEEGRARLRELQVGRNNGTAAQVREGLTEGQFVIVYPPDHLATGTGWPRVRKARALNEK